MTPAALRAALSRLGQTQTGAARLLDVEARTVRRWAAGDVPAPGPVRLLLDLIEHVPGARERLEERAQKRNIRPKTD